MHKKDKGVTKICKKNWISLTDTQAEAHHNSYTYNYSNTSTNRVGSKYKSLSINDNAIIIPPLSL